jgi:hypothetical protein
VRIGEKRSFSGTWLWRPAAGEWGEKEMLMGAVSSAFDPSVRIHSICGGTPQPPGSKEWVGKDEKDPRRDDA